MDESSPQPAGGRGDEPLAVLAGFGLSGYMARAYLALLELGPSQAREVSERSGVPQGRVYDILEKLHQRGLAEVLPEAPRRYQAVPFETFLERELTMHRDRVVTLERDRQGLVEVLRRVQGGAPAAERGEYLVLRGRKNLLERVVALQRGARQDVLAIGSERAPVRLNGQDGVGEMPGRGVRLRVLAPLTEANAEAARGLLASGAEVRHHAGLADTFPPGLNVLLGDGQRAMLYQHVPDDLDAAKGDDVGLFIEHPEMVKGLQALGESLWTFAQPGAERLAELARGGEPGPILQRVLLVEDEPDVLHSLQELLERSLEGVEVRGVENGAAGLEALRKEPVDLIITDYKLPGMNGLEFLDEAAKLAPGVQRILITAFPDLKLAIRAINEASVEHFLTKPFQSRQVVNIVRAVLSERRERALRNQLLARAVEQPAPAPALPRPAPKP